MEYNTKGIHSDKSEIEYITNVFFDIFTNANKQPDWAIINRVCIPQTIIIKKSDTAEVVYNLDGFIEPRRKILSDGTLTGFQESEIKEETKIIGTIAQRFSRFQKSGYLNGEYFKAYGNKLFQFIKTTNGWIINSVIWEDDKIEK